MLTKIKNIKQLPLLIFIVMIIISFFTNQTAFNIIKLKKIKKPMLSNDMMRGYYLESAFFGKEDPESESIYYSEGWLRHAGINTSYRGGNISFNIKAFKERREAIRYYKFMTERWARSKDNKKGHFGKGFGDDYELLIRDTKDPVRGGVDRIHLIFITKGTVVVNISGSPPFSDPPSYSTEFFEKVARHLENVVSEW